MLTKIFVLFLGHLTYSVCGRKLIHDHMKDAFDGISFYNKGKGHPYNASFYHELVQCLHKFNDSSLYESQIAGWKGIADYWLTNQTNLDYMGRPDPWGKSPPDLLARFKPFDEFYNRPNVSYGRYHILTYEPCNYESNLAYYHSVTKICNYNWTASGERQNDLLKAWATFILGSAFMHQSYTYIGARFDNLMISVLAYIGHQTVVESL